MNASNFIKSELCRLAWLDGGHEGLNGALAIAFTVRNRVRAGWWNSDWASLLTHHQDYSYYSEPQPTVIPDPRNYAFNRLLQEIDGVFEGTVDDSITVASDSIQQYMKVGGNLRAGDGSLGTQVPVALYYAKSGAITRPWFEQTVCNNPAHKMIATVGTLFFWS